MQSLRLAGPHLVLDVARISNHSCHGDTLDVVDDKTLRGKTLKEEQARRAKRAADPGAGDGPEGGGAPQGGSAGAPKAAGGEKRRRPRGRGGNWGIRGAIWALRGARGVRRAGGAA